MKSFLALCCAAAFTTASVFAADATPVPEKKPGIVKRILLCKPLLELLPREMRRQFRS